VVIVCARSFPFKGSCKFAASAILKSQGTKKKREELQKTTEQGQHLKVRLVDKRELLVETN
jgi:hypothetical protein